MPLPQNRKHWTQTLVIRRVRQVLPSENSLLMALAISVGFLTAIALWIFRVGIEFFHHIFVEKLAHETLHFTHDFGIVITLALAGLIVGSIKHQFVGRERYHGVAAIIESVALSSGHLPYKIMPFKAIASALSLGAGASVGPEDPSVQIGASLGSMIGQRLRIKEEWIGLLVSAGAASAISSAFNAPIAGVFFALEVILHGELATASVSVVILAAVISTGVTQGLGVGEDAMGPFNFTLNSPLEVPFYVPLGLMLAPFAVGFVRMMGSQHHFWHQIKLYPPLKTMLAGAIVGAVGVYLPEVLGGGRETMNEVLRGDMDYALLLFLILAVGKIVMTAISISAGFVGGIFAPALFIGTMLGAIYGTLMNDFFGSAAGDPRAYAIAGMAGMMAGVVRAPVTAIMMVFELTNDYRFILPIMLVTVVCIFIAERFEKYGIYERALVQQGVNLPKGRDIDLMQGISVAEAMSTPAPTIPESATLVELRDSLRYHHRHALCVVNDEGRLSGIVTITDLQDAYSSNGADGCLPIHVGDICTRDVLTAHPEDVLWQAIRNMGARDVGRLPVVDAHTGDLLGMVTRHDIVDAYNTAVHRKMKDQQYAEQIRLNTLTGAHVYEMHVKPNAHVDGRAIKDVTWPPEAVVASILRKGKLLVPHGYTTLRAGDVLMIVADPHAEKMLADLFAEADFMA